MATAGGMRDWALTSWRRDVRQGQRFVKSSGFDRDVWVLETFLDRPGCPRHARLAKENRPSETLTLSVTALDGLFRTVAGEA